MARITVEDCEKFVRNRFELVVLAALRTRQLINGETPKIAPRDGEKKAVIALREIGLNSLPLNDLKEGLVNKFRSVNFMDEDDEDIDELMREDTYCPSTFVDSETATSRPALASSKTNEDVTVMANGSEQELGSDL